MIHTKVSDEMDKIKKFCSIEKLASLQDLKNSHTKKFQNLIRFHRQLCTSINYRIQKLILNKPIRF